MTTAATSHAGMPETTVREPAPAERERVRYLFRQAVLEPVAQLLVAVRSRPIERFVAAAAWWPVGTVGLFQLACEPGVDRTAVTGSLLDKLAGCASLAGMQVIQYANLLTDDSAWMEILRAQGFECSRSERSFEIVYEDVWRRIRKLHEKHGARIPSRWQAKPIRDLPPETALRVIDAYRLLPPATIRAYWQKDSRHGFTLDLSGVLFDGDRAFGALLARRLAEVCYIDVQVVQEPNPILRSLGDLFLMYRMMARHDEAVRAGRDVPIQRVQFRSGEVEHRQTANLALRMGGRELAPQRAMTKKL